MKMLACVGSFSGPFLIGALSDANKGSFVPALLLLSGLVLLASIMNLFFKEPGERPYLFSSTFFLHVHDCDASHCMCEKVKIVLCHDNLHVGLSIRSAGDLHFMQRTQGFPCPCLLKAQSDDNLTSYACFKTQPEFLLRAQGRVRAYYPGSHTAAGQS